MPEIVPACDGICVMASDILEGASRYDVAYPHPGCPLHAPGVSCDCGQRMCMDCGGPWCSACGERVPMEGSRVCDTCAPPKCSCLCHSSADLASSSRVGHSCCGRSNALGYEIATAP